MPKLLHQELKIYQMKYMKVLAEMAIPRVIHCGTSLRAQQLQIQSHWIMLIGTQKDQIVQLEDRILPDIIA